MQDLALNPDDEMPEETEKGRLGYVRHVLKGLELQFARNEGQDPCRLLIGRWLKYETKETAKARSTKGGEVSMPVDEYDYVTLVQYSASYPRGRATALLNWRSGEIEVDPLESCSLVMSLNRAIFLSVEAVCGVSGVGITCERNDSSAFKFLEEGDEWGE